MGREILFRGKHVHALPQNEHLDGQWVYGYLSDENYINSPEEGEFLVDPKTVCQYTGLTDKNGRKIFEGDIVKVQYTDGQEDYVETAEVSFDKKTASFSPWNWQYQCDGCDLYCEIRDIEVIGNIFDNFKLAKTNGKAEKTKCDECRCNSCFYKSDCCSECEGPILDCEEHSETDVYGHSEDTWNADQAVIICESSPCENFPYSEVRKYRDMEQRLKKVYGDCDGLLEKVVEHLVTHEDITLPDPIFKARMLTDGEVDRWERYKATCEWIPCSERLPEEPFGCLVTIIDTNPMTLNVLPYYAEYDGKQWNTYDGPQLLLEVVAWMPLPEPCKLQEEEK